MSRTHVLSACCAAGLVLAGCGPLPNPPLPPRLDDEAQKSVTESWDKVLAPMNRFDGPALLDALLITHAYHYGVDKLEFRSEKSFSGGVVEMAVHFDRAAPERDRVTVTVKDRQGRVLREERYAREQIETAARELTTDLSFLRAKRDQGTATADERRRLDALEARVARVTSVFAPPPDKAPRAAPEK